MTYYETLAFQEYDRASAARECDAGRLTDDEPPTREPSKAEHMAFEADQAHNHLLNWWVNAISPDDFIDLELRAGNTPWDRALGLRVQAARDALRDMARDDVRVMVLLAEGAIWNALKR